jgi:hypothetical protein
MSELGKISQHVATAREHLAKVEPGTTSVSEHLLKVYFGGFRQDLLKMAGVASQYKDNDLPGVKKDLTDANDNCEKVRSEIRTGLGDSKAPKIFEAYKETNFAITQIGDGVREADGADQEITELLTVMDKAVKLTESIAARQFRIDHCAGRIATAAELADSALEDYLQDQGLQA